VLQTRFWIVVIYALLVVAIMVMPGGNALPRFPFADKWAHGLIFTGLGMLSSWSAPKKHVTVITGSLAFAGFTESLQLYVPYRQFEMGDCIADAVGIVLGFAVYQIVRARRRTAGHPLKAP